ncbi:MAG: endonuclease domain-containing protein [Sphingomicrobium sp.]
MSLPEAKLWREVRGSKIGAKVRRQHPIGPNVVDFYVPEVRLVIEVDGEAHNRADRPERDAVRDAYLKGAGYSVWRIAAADVMSNLTGVIQAISSRLANPLHHPSDGPPPRPGEDI